MDNRQIILDCALELFYKKGYDAVGVQEIVDKAGITKPTLYYYFGSKLGLLKQVLEQNYRILQDKLEEAAVCQEDLSKTLYMVADTYLTFAKANKEFYLFMVSLFYMAHENEAYQAVKPIMIEQHERIVSIFEQASGQLGNMRGRQHQFALGFTGIITQYLLLCFEMGDHTEQVAQKLVHQFLYGIYT